MDNIIYIILLLAWVAFGVYKASKKNAAKNASSNNEPMPSSFKTLDRLFESLFPGLADQNTPQNHPYHYDLEEEDNSDDFNEDEVENNSMEEKYRHVFTAAVPDEDLANDLDTYSGSDNVEQAVIIKEVERLDDIQKSSIGNEDAEDEVPFEFDLRHAVISKTILDRPYQ